VQVIDTVELFRLHQKRMLSLRYLCSYLLRRNIQTGNHDSIEDAYAALDLYRKYCELKEAGALQGVIQELYAWGAQNAWQPVVWRNDQPCPADQVP
jgi:PAB-dependent poly(A)-specific ribonuclease subunit 2